MRIAWLSDVHLNFLTPREAVGFLKSVVRLEPDAVLIGGDIGEAPTVEEYLWEISDTLARPVYFVLGNHDYYGGSIAGVRTRASHICRAVPNLRWLSEAGVVELTGNTALVGDGGWADGRNGDYASSAVMLNDYLLIDEFAGLGRSARLRLLNRLGDESAEHLRKVLPRAFDSHPQVILLTHVPPFREGCWHEGKISNDSYLPHFSCRAAGDALVELMRERPQRSLTVLCGHTHSPGTAQILPNLLVRTASAEYGKPVVQDLIEI
ncbi:MAG: metallophosphoesterase [Acidobacteriota bacterium]